MKTGAAGIALIKKYEGLSLKRYLCPAGIPTIGFGHAILPGESYMLINGEQAEFLLRQDLATAERAINTHVHVPLTQHHYDALASFIFNVGTQNFIRSTLLRKLNNRDYAGASTEFLRWNKIGKSSSRGLARRREEESQLFLTPQPKLKE